MTVNGTTNGVSNGHGAVNERDEYAVRIGHREPLKPTGKLDGFKSVDITPVLGTEFPTVKLLDWLESPESDELFRELAITGWYRPDLPSHPSSCLQDYLCLSSL